jgi:CheY-like chemotaxis protein
MSARIMVVDDEEVTGRLLLYQLQGFGYQAFHVQDGLQALQRVLLEQPDLILLDVMMPHVSGWDVCREIRSCSTVPIIMVTAKDADDDIATGLAAGADDYVAKPFNMTQLQARIEAVLRRTSQRQKPAIPANEPAAEISQPPRKITPAIPIAPRMPLAADSVPERPAPAARPMVREKTPVPASPATPRPAPAVGFAQALPVPPPAMPANQTPKMRLGRRFQNERQARNLSLYQAERLCRVRWDFLQALENENWTYLPKLQLQQAIESYALLLRIDLHEYTLEAKPASTRQLYYQAAAVMVLITVLALVLLMMQGRWL